MFDELDHIRVLIVDDSADVADALAALFRHAAPNDPPRLECVGTMLTTRGITEQVRSCSPHVVLIDRSIPGEDTPAAIAELASSAPEVCILAFTGWDDPQTTREMTQAGAFRLVSKHADPTAMVHTVRDAFLDWRNGRVAK